MARFESMRPRKDIVRVTPHRLLCSILAGAGTLACMTSAADLAHAQSKLEARYVATLAGVPVGRGSWVIEIGDDYFTAAASGATAGILRVFAAGQGTSAARGTMSGNHLVATAYASSIAANKRTDQVRIAISGGSVREFAVDPTPKPDPARVPLTDAHRRGVSDPMTASLTRMPGSGEPLSREACQRTVSVFDGRLRYDLKAEYKRMDKVKAEKGYQGAVVVCAVYFSPVAGHVPDRATIKYLAEQRDMEIWLAPIAGTRVLVPFRMSVPTPIGHGVLEATHFVTTPLPTPASAKTQ
jgi:hypothetical protein